MSSFCLFMSDGGEIDKLMGCKNSSEQAKPDPQPSNRGAQSNSGIQTSKQPTAVPSTAPPTKEPPALPDTSPPVQPTKVPSVTLHYFDLYGRGEVFRMIFTYLKVSYTDHRVEFSEWPTLKTSPLCEFGVLPVLDINGRRLAQTRSIMRYVCQVYYLYPTRTSLKDIYLTESVCDLIDDLRTPLITLIFNKDADGIAKHYDSNIEAGLEMLETRLANNPANSGFFLGGAVSMSDFAVFEFLWDYFLMPQKREAHGGRVQKHAKLSQFAERMSRLNLELENYLSSRSFKWL